jgi:integrase
VTTCPFCGSVHQRLRFDTPKSAAGIRAYPLVPLVVDALKAHRERQDDDRRLFGADYADHGLVFARPDGNPWRPDWISREFRRLMRTSGAAKGLDQVPPLKSLRSTMVTNLHEVGAPLEVISKVAGHAGGEVTRDHYL